MKEIEFSKNTLSFLVGLGVQIFGPGSSRFISNSYPKYVDLDICKFGQIWVGSLRIRIGFCL